jgi:cell division protease FtsH
VAEELVFDRISTGASNDIKMATDLAQKMVRNWGMSDELGPLSYSKDEEHIFLGREIAQHRDYSDGTAKKIDEEVRKIIQGSYKTAKLVLGKNLDILHSLHELLLEKETVMGAELDQLIHTMRPGIDLPSKGSQKKSAKEEKKEADTKPSASVDSGSESTP